MSIWSAGTTLRSIRRRLRLPVGGGCRRHRTSPTIPSEPPSLAHPTRRAAAAEKGGPSLWWARATEIAGSCRPWTAFLRSLSAVWTIGRGSGRIRMRTTKMGLRDGAGERASYVVRKMVEADWRVS